MLENTLNDDFKRALKEQNKLKVSVIRMLKADMGNTALKLKKNSLSDDEVIKVIQKHIKQHNDSIEQFKKGNRQDLVEKEQQELAILKTYVPEQLSDEELDSLIKSVMGELNATTKKEMGIVVKTVLEKAQGKADGKRVSHAVQNFLK